MQSTSPHVDAISDLATGNSNDATPFAQQSVVLTKQAYVELKWQAHYWQAQHARALEREAALIAKVEALEATVRDLTQRLYGTKSEKTQVLRLWMRLNHRVLALGVNSLAARAMGAVTVRRCWWCPKSMT